MHTWLFSQCLAIQFKSYSTFAMHVLLDTRWMDMHLQRAPIKALGVTQHLFAMVCHCIAMNA